MLKIFKNPLLKLDMEKKNRKPGVSDIKKALLESDGKCPISNRNLKNLKNLIINHIKSKREQWK